MSDAAQFQADLETHHIEGYAAAALARGHSWEQARFNVPLISHIEGNLWVGGCIDGVELPHDFQTVVSLYKWENYQLGPNTTRLVVTMYDAHEVDHAIVFETAEFAAGAIERGKTLIHCQAGLNRSSLIAALVLVKLGRTPSEALALLREKRSPVVLCNKAFEDFLLGTEELPW